jgi:predicted ATPase/DNA-binding winged helix-turn-helix (wHTH) protein
MNRGRAKRVNLVKKDSTASTHAPQAGEVASFGAYSLIPNERLLTKNGTSVPLGARAFDILLALVSQSNEVVSKRDLLARVWPDVHVEESSLRFHVAILRKALGDGEGGARYIATLAGKGYCFVARVSWSDDRGSVSATISADFKHANLPSRVSRIVGRDKDIRSVSTDLIAERLVTIVGPGGVGKTTLAVAVGHHLIEEFSGAALFVDLSTLNDPDLVAVAIISMLGLSVQSNDATSDLITYLRDRRLLLILDTCEHVVEAVAALASRLFPAAPQIHILATSRELLQVEGEHVYRLESLACPPDDGKVTAELAQRFPAPQLFIDRALASGAHLTLTDAEAGTIVSICRKLGGVPLAIELAARRVEAYGLGQTAALLDQHMSLMWQGPRTAPPRQRTLRATLDWSFSLLSGSERMVLCQLAVFVGYFSLDAALAVVTSASAGKALILEAIDSLVAKSMVAAHSIGPLMFYRLLDTTRDYALAGADSEESAGVAARHAAYYRQWLEETATHWSTLPTGTECTPYFAGLNNVRAALEWCFDSDNDLELGVALAAAAVPTFFTMSLLTECHRWSERALLALDDANRGGRDEMQLQTCLGLTLTITKGHSEAAVSALNRSLAIAKARGDLLNEVRLLGPLHVCHMRCGEFKVALQYARRSCEIANTLGDSDSTALAHALLGCSLHLMGDLKGGREELEAALALRPDVPANRAIYFGCDHYSWADLALTTTLWLQGYPAQAIARAHQAIKDGEHMHHPVSLAIVMNAIVVLLWIGDLDAAEQHVDWFISKADSQNVKPYLDLGYSLRGDLAVRRGNTRAGVEMLRNFLPKLHVDGYERLTTRFNLTLASGLAATGELEEGVTLLDDTARLIELKGDSSYLPELLRLKASILLSMPKPGLEDAEKCFVQSLELSRAHGSRTWELRTATDLATLWATQGRANDAHSMLGRVFEKFTEGFDTTDLKAAERLLVKLRQSPQLNTRGIPRSARLAS